jgi:hypothetical protein
MRDIRPRRTLCRSLVATVLFLLSVAVERARAFPSLYQAENYTSTTKGILGGTRFKYMPVYCAGVLDRILTVSPQNGQFQGVLELMLEWEDRTAMAAILNETARIQSGSKNTCVKPCLGGDTRGLCCDGLFTLNLQFANAVSPPALTTNIFVRDGTVRQVSQISGSFYGSFELKNYPFGKLQADISIRLTPMLYVDESYVTPLPVPIAATILTTNLGDSAGNGWYASDAKLLGNIPAYVRQVDRWYFTNPAEDKSLANFRGASITSEQVLESQEQIGSFVSDLDTTSPELDFQFTLSVGSVDSFITMLPLALLALLNLAVFLLPLLNVQSRIQFSITLFFTTSTTLLTQNFGGTNQLNAIQRLAVVIFTMLVFTVFSTLIWNALYSYRQGRAEFFNDWNFLTGKWHRTNIIAPATTPSQSVSKFSLQGSGADSESGEEQLKSHTFGERWREDSNFRLAWCKFCDRCSLLTCFIVYLLSFTLICTMSSDGQVNGLGAS